MGTLPQHMHVEVRRQLTRPCRSQGPNSALEAGPFPCWVISLAFSFCFVLLRQCLIQPRITLNFWLSCLSVSQSAGIRGTCHKKLQKTSLIHKQMCVCLCVCICVCMCICVYECVYAYMYVCSVCMYYVCITNESCFLMTEHYMIKQRALKTKCTRSLVILSRHWS